MHIIYVFHPIFIIVITLLLLFTTCTVYNIQDGWLVVLSVHKSFFIILDLIWSVFVVIAPGFVHFLVVHWERCKPESKLYTANKAFSDSGWWLKRSRFGSLKWNVIQHETNKQARRLDLKTRLMRDDWTWNFKIIIYGLTNKALNDLEDSCGITNILIKQILDTQSW